MKMNQIGGLKSIFGETSLDSKSHDAKSPKSCSLNGIFGESPQNLVVSPQLPGSGPRTPDLDHSAVKHDSSGGLIGKKTRHTELSAIFGPPIDFPGVDMTNPTKPESNGNKNAAKPGKLGDIFGSHLLTHGPPALRNCNPYGEYQDGPPNANANSLMKLSKFGNDFHVHITGATNPEIFATKTIEPSHFHVTVALSVA